MRKLHLPQPVIACTTALAFVLAGCDVNIEPTDLSSVTAEKDRTVIESTLGKPSQVVEERGFTVASYSYNKGIFVQGPSGGSGGSSMGGGYAPGMEVLVLGALVLVAILGPIEYANRSSEARAEQKGQLAAIFDGDDKLVFAGSLDNSEPTPGRLTSIVARYTEAQAGNEAAFIYLAKITLIPGQKRTFLETAANNGSGEAAFELGEAHKFGASVEQSDREAGRWWLTAGRRDYVPAYTKLGQAYMAGTGVKRDLEQARVWFAKAAENGDEEAAEIAADLKAVLSHIDAATPEAKYALALAYERGNVLPVNFPEAERLLRESAEAGYAPAQALYADRGSDLVKALKWHRLAADRGLASSQTYVGLMYVKGNAGVSLDTVEALKWFYLAAAQNDEVAKQYVRVLTPSLSVEEKSEARRRAENWHEAHLQ